MGVGEASTAERWGRCGHRCDRSKRRPGPGRKQTSGARQNRQTSASAPVRARCGVVPTWSVLLALHAARLLPACRRAGAAAVASCGTASGVRVRIAAVEGEPGVEG